jgi:Tol biopolymer transport system component
VADKARGTNQIYIYDFQTTSNILVSSSFDGTGPGNTNSDSPCFSPDGRFVAYRSDASNLVPGDNNGDSDVFVYDRSSGATILASANQFGGKVANGPSFAPAFSGDSTTLFFESWASDLGVPVFNSSSEIWAFSLYSSNGPPLGLTIASPVAGGPGGGPEVRWSVTPGKTYQVQYKTDLSEPTWHVLPSGFTVILNQGYLTDPAPGVGSRFYRVVSF